MFTHNLLRSTTSRICSALTGGGQARTVRSLLPVVLLTLGGVAGLADEAVAQERPTLSFELTPLSISENGGTSSLTASLSGPASADVTTTVEVYPIGDVPATDLIQTGTTTLTFEAGSTTATGTVDFSAVNDEVYSGTRQFRVSTSTSPGGAVTVARPFSFRLTITDDETRPTLSVDLMPSSIDENGGVSSLTASLSGPARFEVTVEVTGFEPTNDADLAAVTQTGSTLTIQPGSTTATGTVEFTAVDNDVYDRGGQYRVYWSSEGDVQPVGANVELLTITNDEARPTLSFELTPSSISENGGTSSLTASLNGPALEDVTTTVEVYPIGDVPATDLIQTGTTTLTFEAGSTTATGTVDFSAVNDEVYSGTRQFRVSTSTSSGGAVTVAQPFSFRLTITDDETRPTLSVDLMPSSIDENGGVSSLTASLSGPARFEVTVEVTGFEPTNDADLAAVTQTGSTLTIQPGSTTATGTVEFTAVDNDVYDRGGQYRVYWSSEGDVQPVGANVELLTITNDEGEADAVVRAHAVVDQRERRNQQLDGEPERPGARGRDDDGPDVPDR